MLLGRARELAALDTLLQSTRDGMSAVLVLRGEPGIGLSALLDRLVESAADMLVIRIAGVEAEIQLAFAGVHQLVKPLLDGLDRLPAPQYTAVATAFGLAAGDRPDEFLVGLGVLTLLSAAAAERPLLCVVDDAQWLDPTSAKALAFVARRLHADSIAFAFALNEPTHAPDGTRLPGLPELYVEGLDADDARTLLEGRVAGALEAGVRERLVAESGGNPLALHELAGGLTDDELSGVDRLPEALALGDHLANALLAEVRRQPPETQTLLLLAAASPDTSPELLWRAAERLGLSPDAAAPAEAHKLLRLGGRIDFGRPLLRTAIYGEAPLAERRRVHQSLADAAEDETEPEVRAWHLGTATLEPDEGVAASLERSAGRARASPDASARLLERAARLSPDAERRTGRLLAAAQAELLAGAPGRAGALVAEASARATAPLEVAQALRLRAMTALALGEGEAAAMLARAARSLEPLDVRLARETYLQALDAAVQAGRFRGPDLSEVATVARSAPPPDGDPSVADRLLDGLALLVLDGHAAAAPTIRSALEALGGTDDPRWLTLGIIAAVELWDEAAVGELTALQVRLARERGALGTLAPALDRQAGLDDVAAGRFESARERLSEARDITLAAGEADPGGGPRPGLVIATAWSGDVDATRREAEQLTHDALARGLGRYVDVAPYALAVLELGLGQYEEALSAARSAVDGGALGVVTLALPELVEAAVRTGERRLAAEAVDRLGQRVAASGTPWALGMLARSQALVAEGPEAERLYLDALVHLRLTRAAPQLARAHLVYGEWLRRTRRRRDAREQLSTAHALFRAMGVRAFGERSRIELVATGKRMRSRTEPPVAAVLTPQETQVARLVSDGATNSEIGAQMFISPRTVEYHLHKVFRKLQVTSRTQLAGAMLRGGGTPP